MAFSNYLRMYRRRWHLTQQELAFLLGYADQSIITRLEQEERAVTLAAAYACKLIFGVEPEKIFSALLSDLEDRVLNRIQTLRNRLLQEDPTQITLYKVELLREVIVRLSAIPETEA